MSERGWSYKTPDGLVTDSVVQYANAWAELVALAEHAFPGYVAFSWDPGILLKHPDRYGSFELSVHALKILLANHPSIAESLKNK